MKSMHRAALMLALLAGTAACGDLNKHNPNDLIADIGVTKSQLIVKNGDPYVWRDVEITLNGSYRYHADYVPRGSSSFSYKAFVNSQGESYSPGRLKVRQVEIRAKQQEGGTEAAFKW
ncbi:hypothetical protein PaecuDRAFT_4728 [Paenibacillus curdlanolyticus YK9]|uniref:Lipoprotein n=1 Tax=Paenibacillus curdlanolyticus YK9 TaxID=717606 RepID=E0IGD5_9BACL|nr:hypothetical protein [Paenibacillus curdlanolyticus]EFM08435.1 hypothetical protein PaecuDRAFT_4728 [Paenibacillus curdlanolyticus YK9]